MVWQLLLIGLNFDESLMGSLEYGDSPHQVVIIQLLCFELESTHRLIQELALWSRWTCCIPTVETDC